jgi:hypothetical protein
LNIDEHTGPHVGRRMYFIENKKEEHNAQVRIRTVWFVRKRVPCAAWVLVEKME